MSVERRQSSDDFENLRRRFQTIADRVAELGLHPEDALTSLKSFVELNNSLRSTLTTSVDRSIEDRASTSTAASQDDRCARQDHPRRPSAAFIVVGLLVVTAWILKMLGQPVDPFRYLVSAWLEVEDVVADACLLSTDTPVADLFRPPVDCAQVCRDVFDVDRVAYSELGRDVFEARYAYTGRPVIVSGAMANWSAPTTFSFDYFRKLYDGINGSRWNTSPAEDCQFFAWGASEFGSLREVLHMDADRAAMKAGTKPWYFGWSNCDSTVANILRTQYTRPAFLPETSESSATDWIFMGSPGYGAPLHVDSVGNPSWQAQVIGSKKWILEPPSECYLDCVTRIEVTVNAGDIIVLDTNQWYHSTTVVGSQMSITIGSEYD